MVNERLSFVYGWFLLPILRKLRSVNYLIGRWFLVNYMYCKLNKSHPER